MIEKFRSYLFITCAIVLVAGLVMYVYILSKGDGDVFGGGRGTLPPTAFETLTYTSDDTGYLLCSLELCKNASSDANSPLFNVDAVTLRRLVADYTDADPAIKTQNFDFRISQFEFLERMPGKPFPSVVSVRILPVNNYSSKLAFYSFTPVGKSQKDEHQERAAQWLAALRDLAHK